MATAQSSTTHLQHGESQPRLTLISHPQTLTEYLASQQWRGEKWQYHACKRMYDVVLATLLLMVFAVCTLPVIAWRIKQEDGGPIFFKQTRVGQNGQHFTIWKLRTLTIAASQAKVTPVLAQDARITRVGHTLRRTNLDEIPQLWNVIKGEMSLVGPRPHAVEEDIKFATQFGPYRARMQAKPGMTGLAQINEAHGPIQTLEDLQTRTAYDLAYIQMQGLKEDIAILYKTLFMVLRRC